MAKGDIKTTITGNMLTISNSAGSITFDTERVSAEIHQRLAVHGAKQKICDAAAIPRDTETGRSATPAQKLDAMRTVAERLLAGEWGAERTGAANALHVPTLIRAIIEVTSALESKVVEMVEGLDNAGRVKLRDNPRIAPVYARIRSEQLGGDLDTDEMLDELMA